MSTSPQAASAPISKGLLWTSYVLSAIPVLMLLFSAYMKIAQPQPKYGEGLAHIGWPIELSLTLAALELTCTLLYLIPRTSVLGAVLLAAYLGGATATHLRVGDPLQSVLTPAILGMILWLGLWLREPRLKALLPLRSS